MKVDGTTLIYAIIIVVVIIIIGILVYYYLPSSEWNSFTLNYGDTFQSSSVGSKLQKINLANLRWKNCIFTVTYNSKTYTQDVTKMLNNSTSVYLYYNKTTLDYDLMRPLNYGTFPITGFKYQSTNSISCLADTDCTTATPTLKNNFCVKNIPDVAGAKIDTTNCTFAGGATTASSSFIPYSANGDSSLAIGINKTDPTSNAYIFPSTVPAKYATNIAYNTLYCAATNSENTAFEVDWLQLASGYCTLSGLAFTGDSVKLTGSFRIFPYL